MSRNFDDVTAWDRDNDAKIQFTQRDFDPCKGHTAEASVSDRTLTVTVTIGDKIYQRVIRDVDVQADVTVDGTEQKHVYVTVIKNTKFNMKEKL